MKGEIFSLQGRENAGQTGNQWQFLEEEIGSPRLEVCVSFFVMATREDLEHWLTEALAASGGSASIVEVCKYIWANHEADLKDYGDLFYTWQYDVRWAANRLRRKKVMRSVEQSPPHVWELAPSAFVQATS
ncbi:MAG: hypothetical protein ACE14M_08750 [Terriglobales bacterium]